jgi:KRAB domain-containing zinc finger protein
MEEHAFSHVGEKPYQCLSCAKSFNSKYCLKRHGVVHTGVKVYDCSVCGKSFNDKGNLQQHMRIHTGQKPYKCSTCEQTFTWKNQLQNHMPVHTNEKFYCFLCHKSFGFRNSFMQHARYDFGGHRCSLCGHVYTSQLDILSHEQAHVIKPT